MAFYGSTFSNDTWNSSPRPMRHARHIACPQRLKYIHDISDGFIACVEDAEYLDRSSSRNVFQSPTRSGLYNAADIWRQELMSLAQQVQSSFVSFDDIQPTRSARSNYYRQRLNTSTRLTPHLEENSEHNISKRLLNRRSSPRSQYSYTPKHRIIFPENDQQNSNINMNKNQDPGIWLLPILCYTLQVDNIVDAQEWLVNANPTEKRLAMELISRTMHDMQNRENEHTSEIPFYEQTSNSLNNFNNVYWPYKFWQHQRQVKPLNDNNDKCERATSPVRILSPAKRLPTPAVSTRPIQTAETSRCSTASSRLLTPLITTTNHEPPPPSRRGHRITTSRGNTSDHDRQSISGSIHGKTPLI